MKKTNKIFLILLTSVSLLVGCDLDINQDPNRPTDRNIIPSVIFPAAAHGVGQRVASPNFTFLNNWLGYWSGSGGFAIDQTETTYNITTTFGNVIWGNHYNALFDLEQIRSKSLSQVNKDSVLAGASIILSAMLWQDLVDIYGNIPYTQALQYETYPQPVYDKGQFVYDDLQKKLDQSILLMKAKLSNVQKANFASADVVNHGSTTKWIKFANTLKLRLLIHQSEVPGFNPASVIAKIIANGGVLHSGETVSVNPGYVAKERDKQSPFFDNFGLTINDADAAPSVRANVYFVDQLKARDDVRSILYFKTISGNVIPTVYGLTAGNPLASSGIGSGLARSATQDQWIFTSVESLFLEAESIQRGWMAGDAATAYKSAVTESFLFLNDPALELDIEAQAAEYIVNNPAGTLANLLYQKYTAMCGIAPIESWSDLRRMGFGTILGSDLGYISANPSALSKSSIPNRLLYPESEYSSNTSNVKAEGQINQFTSKIFWQP
ncbi:MAG: SusD/RagB family nutrient-binding outer membrane lipoprotein [Cyclobacteriaceae bacterium]|nr:SusD/RagB family nutrient-binding outer membrane lipoprotein [Cyclobacteriaceae bacterium]